MSVAVFDISISLADFNQKWVSVVNKSQQFCSVTFQLHTISCTSQTLIVDHFSRAVARFSYQVCLTFLSISWQQSVRYRFLIQNNFPITYFLFINYSYVLDVKECSLLSTFQCGRLKSFPVLHVYITIFQFVYIALRFLTIPPASPLTSIHIPHFSNHILAPTFHFVFLFMGKEILSFSLHHISTDVFTLTFSPNRLWGFHMKPFNLSHTTSVSFNPLN